MWSASNAIAPSLITSTTTSAWWKFLKGMVSGLYAGNYDITHMFIDSLCRVVPSEGGPEVEEFLDWLEDFSEKNNIKFTVTISADAELAHEGVRKYF